MVETSQNQGSLVLDLQSNNAWPDYTAHEDACTQTKLLFNAVYLPFWRFLCFLSGSLGWVRGYPALCMVGANGQTVSKFNVQATLTCVCVCVACICLSLYAYMISTKCVSKDAHVHSC